MTGAGGAGTRRSAAFLAVLFCLAAAVLSPASAAQSGPFPDLPIQYYRLRNGLRVILCSDTSLPIVSVIVAYGAGSVREKDGQYGLAYFLENMMFQGSENVGPLQHISYIQKIGGELNAQTRFEKTVFYETLPSNQLGLALWLESDRMRSLSISPSGVEKVRQELLGDLEQRKAREPYYFCLANFDTLLYPDHLYGHPWLDAGDLRSLSLEDVRDFYRTYYVPNNAVLCITGNIQFAKARELVSKYFDSVPPGADVPVPRLPAFEQENEVSGGSSIPVGASSGFLLGFRFHPVQGNDYYAARILEYILLKGQGSRLTGRLVKRDVSGSSLEGWIEERGRSLSLKMIFLNRSRAVLDHARKTMMAEFEKLKTASVADNELTRAKRMFKSDFMRQMGNRVERAMAMIDLVWADKAPESLPDEFESFMKVERQDIMRFVGRYMVPRNRVIFDMGEK